MNQYLEFRHDFRLDDRGGEGELLISSDSNYAAWLNDQFVDCGQYQELPPRRVFDRLNICSLLRPGANVLRIVVYHQGVDSFQYVKAEPGLLFSIRVGEEVAASGTETRWRSLAGYGAGAIARVTCQLGFSFAYDARIEPQAWQQLDEQDCAPEQPPLLPRPVRKLTLCPRAVASVCAQGTFRRNETYSQDAGAGPLMQRDLLSTRFPREFFTAAEPLSLPSRVGIEIVAEKLHGDGAYILVDLQRQQAGILEIEVDADAGVCLDIAYGEHRDDGRVRAAVGGRNFANRYICRAGRQSFAHYYSRLAGRYLEIHASGIKSRLRLHYAGLRPTEYPVEARGTFSCPDSMMRRIYTTSTRTLHLCMHEHYEDSPWREQALYAFDARNQALCGYHCFGDYRFAAASFDLLGRSLGEDGYQEMCAPARIEITIPSFSFAWVLAVADHLLYSGDRAFATRMWPLAQRMLRTHLGRLQDGLLPCPVGQRYWQFYDWAEGLDGSARILDPSAPRFDAPLNLLFCLALSAAAKIAVAAGDAAGERELSAAAERLRPAIGTAFWDAREAAYQSYVGAGAQREFAELVQALALLTGVPGPEAAPQLRQRLARPANGMTAITLSHSLLKFEALLAEPETYGGVVFDSILREWGGMLYAGATTFWETRRGADDFSQAGSLCHGWSAVPLYFYSAYLLGVRPLEPGFRRFTVKPIAGIVPSASGAVPTPFGPIQVGWSKCGDTIDYHRLDHPRETQLVTC